MKHDLNTIEKRPYHRPEAELYPLRLQENIAASNEPAQTIFYDDEFNGEDDAFS